MAAPDWSEDVLLLTDLRAALAPPAPIASEYTAVAHEVFRAARIAQVAQLTYDSACDPAPAGPTRSSRSARLLSFRSDGCSIDVEITAEGLLGQIYPTPRGRVIAQSGATAGTTEAALDEAGNFELPLPPPGPFSLRAELTDQTIVTDWFVLR